MFVLVSKGLIAKLSGLPKALPIRVMFQARIKILFYNEFISI